MKVIECIPNFSDARRPEVVEAIVNAVAQIPNALRYHGRIKVRLGVVHKGDGALGVVCRCRQEHWWLADCGIVTFWAGLVGYLPAGFVDRHDAPADVPLHDRIGAVLLCGDGPDRAGRIRGIDTDQGYPCASGVFESVKPS